MTTDLTFTSALNITKKLNFIFGRKSYKYVVAAADVLLLNMFISFDLFIRFSVYLNVDYVFLCIQCRYM